MSKKLKRKTIFVVLVEIVCLVLFGTFLMKMQTDLSVENQIQNTKEKLDGMQELISSADEAAHQNQLSYDEVYQSKAESVAFMANNSEAFETGSAYLKDLAALMDVNNIIIVEKDGKQIGSAQKTAADFTLQRFNQLRTVFGTGRPSEAFEVQIGEINRRYYGAMIDDGSEVVIEQDPEELARLQEETSSWESMLGNVNVGLKGFSFAVSNQDYTFLYYPEDDMIGRDALDAGIDVNALADNCYSWMSISGERFYCGVKSIPDRDAFVVCAVPESEIASSRNITVAIVLAIFFIVLTVITVYAVLLLREQERDPELRREREERQKKVSGGIAYNKVVGGKILTFSLLGVIAVFGIAFYMQTLFSLSLRAVSNTHQAEEVGETLQQNESDIETVTSQYNSRYLNKCQVAAYILGENPQLQTKEKLAELSSVLGAEFLMVFDEKGREVVSDSSYVNFELSTDPEEQSYDFRRLLQGVEYFIQEAQPDELSGRYFQYIGVPMKNKDGDAEGFVQMAVKPEKLEQALATTSLTNVLNNVKASAGGFAFAIDKETQNFIYYPDDRIQGKNALEYGIKEKQLRDGYCDYLSINGQKYFASSFETEDSFIYIAVPEKKLEGTRLPVALASGIACVICLVILFFLLSFSRRSAHGEVSGKDAKEGPMVDVVMPDGSVKKSESAASRWANDAISWSDKTPEQKVSTLLKSMISVLALAICIAVVFKDRFFGEDSIFLHILEGRWEKGVNVFSITASIMIICVCQVIVMLLKEVLRMLTKTLGAKGATICRMVRSFVKYFFVIAMLYYCLALFGIDTKTLLASAGILSFVVGLGAKELLTDILSGLFIIFEGEFQVGDIVTVGDWRGTVQEIGIRTTKIMDPGENVKVISNSAISGVINMTKRNSYCFCDVGIEYGESLERVESILSRELPKMKEAMPAITDGPFYKGVVSLGDNSVNIRIVAQCKESDRAQLGRDMNRHMKLLFDKYDINIPFPQVVLNQPKDYQQATIYDKIAAEKFNEEQKEMSKNIVKETASDK